MAGNLDIWPARQQCTAIVNGGRSEKLEGDRLVIQQAARGTL